MLQSPAAIIQHIAEHTLNVYIAQGEAVAFALGGTKKMVRAKSLVSLINAGSRTAAVSCVSAECRGVGNAAALLVDKPDKINQSLETTSSADAATLDKHSCVQTTDNNSCIASSH